MALEVELILLEPRDVEFLTRRAALELAGNVLLVVADDPGSGVSYVQVCVERGFAYFVIIPVVLTPSVRWVTRNLPASLIGL